MVKKTKFTLEDEEKIGNFVKNNEVLFNVQHIEYRDAELKNRLWLELANELNVDMPTIKKKWKSMRDYHVSLKRKKTTGSAAKLSKWDDALSFLDNTSILKRATISNIDTPISEFEERELHSIFGDSQSLSSFTERDNSPVPKKHKPNRTQETTNDILRELISSRPKASDFYSPPPPKKKTEVSKFFDSMAETVEKFNDVAIARIKMQIAQIVLGEEVKWAEEQETKQQQQNSKHVYLLGD